MGMLILLDKDIAEQGVYAFWTGATIVVNPRLRHYGLFLEPCTLFFCTDISGRICVGNAQVFFMRSGCFFVSFYEYTSGLMTIGDHQCVDMDSADVKELKLHRLTSDFQVVDPYPKKGIGKIGLISSIDRILTVKSHPWYTTNKGSS
jgi:hypothetical protein